MSKKVIETNSFTIHIKSKKKLKINTHFYMDELKRSTLNYTVNELLLGQSRIKLPETKYQ